MTGMGTCDQTPSPWAAWPADMLASFQAIDLIKRFEPLDLVARARGHQTIIGYRHAIHGDDKTNATQQEANHLLRQDVRQIERCIAWSVDVQLRQGQFDALTSWIFDMGETAWLTSKACAALRAGDYDATGQHLAYSVESYVGQRPDTAIRRAAENHIWLLQDKEKAGHLGRRSGSFPST